jgi:dihydrofolate reductase
MAKLTYAMGPTSLDGYVSDRDGNFDWSMPGPDLHLHAGAELDRAGTLIYGRNMYDLMVYWETADQLPGATPADIAFAKSWQAPDKIVASGTLTEVKSQRTRLVPSLGADDISKLKAAATRPISLSGPTLASRFLNEQLVDEVSTYIIPLVVGGGLPMFKDIERPIRLEQIEEQRLDGGYTFVRYAVKR